LVFPRRPVVELQPGLRESAVSRAVNFGDVNCTATGVTKAFGG
jgi:hypothetical protein